MRTMVSRWFVFGVMLGCAGTHSMALGQPADKKAEVKSAPKADKLRQGLEKSITVDFTGQSLVDVLNHLHEKTGLPISVDQHAIMMTGMSPDNPGQGQCQVKATNEKASDVLSELLSAHQLSYVTYEGAILVTTEDMALVRQMRQRVSVGLEGVPFKNAVRDLAKAHGINLVIDPKIAKEADTAVSLQLDNSGIETTLRLLSELANLKAVRMGNVLFITSVENAKAIREDEAQQLDRRSPSGITYGHPGMGRGMAPLPVQVILRQRGMPPVGGFAPPGVIVPPDRAPGNVIPPRPVDGNGVTPAPAPPMPAGLPVPPPATGTTTPPVAPPVNR